MMVMNPTSNDNPSIPLPKKTIIVVRGTMGVGKTKLCEELSKTLKDSFWLDGDCCWTMNPWVFSEENKAMVLSNIKHILRNFFENSSCKFILFSWVLHDMDILDDILAVLSNENYDLRIVTLTCSEKVLISRLQKRERKDLIEKSIKHLSLYDEKDHGTLIIDTTNMTIDKTIERILNER